MRLASGMPSETHTIALHTDMRGETVCLSLMHPYPRRLGRCSGRIAIGRIMNAHHHPLNSRVAPLLRAPVNPPVPAVSLSKICARHGRSSTGERFRLSLDLPTLGLHHCLGYAAFLLLWPWMPFSSYLRHAREKRLTEFGVELPAAQKLYPHNYVIT